MSYRRITLAYFGSVERAESRPCWLALLIMPSAGHDDAARTLLLAAH